MEGQYCVDLLNNTVLPSKIYSPGPDPCTSCTCDNGAPTLCKVILCATPKNCRLVHPHTTCCNFECHENIDPNLGVLGGPPSSPDRVLSFNELTLRFVVIAFTVFISMSLVAFLIHRLKKRKLRGRQPRPLGVEDNRIGYIEGSIRGSIRYLPEYVAYEPPHAALWKPHGYFPAGEAPPPYEEAVAAARAEAALQTHSIPTDTPSLGIVSTVTMPYHRTIPLNLLSGNSHATTTTTAVIVRSNVHYDTLPQASQTSNALDNTRHPSLTRHPTPTSTSLAPISNTSTSLLPNSNTSTDPPTHPPPSHSHHPSSCQGNTPLDLLKSPSYQTPPKTPGKHKMPPGVGGAPGGGMSPQNIYANVPSPNATSFMAACKERASYPGASNDKYHDKNHSGEREKSHDKSDRLSCKNSAHYPKYEKCTEMAKLANKHDYIYLTKTHESDSRTFPSRADVDRKHHELKIHDGHHAHKKHKKVQHGPNSGARNLTMPKIKTGKAGGGKTLHTNYLALEKQYDTILSNSLKQTPGHHVTHPVSHHARSGGVTARASVATISSSYGSSHHSTIPNYFTTPLAPSSDAKSLCGDAKSLCGDAKSLCGDAKSLCGDAKSLPLYGDKLSHCADKPLPLCDVIKPPSIYKSSTTPTLLSHLSNSNPILSLSLDSNDEDYIDECENCRSDVIPSGDESSRMQDLETMTLQRSRPNCYEDFTEEKFASTSLTLPTHCRVQRPSPMNNGPPPVINRFSSILSQSSLSEEDD
ncbi:hypothetical protein M8J75_005344 [Diaphorina citri]|nr:hypothetical protein M8J75_005344 [Diaphorina citri]